MAVVMIGMMVRMTMMIVMIIMYAQCASLDKDCVEWNQGQDDDDDNNDNHCDGQALFLKSRLHSTIDPIMQTLQWQRRADILHVIRSCN